ncbi:MAG: ROK family protein [Candidatus Sumerlaeaceae bacterium]
MSLDLVLGIDLGGTDCKFGIVDAQGRVIRSSKNPTRAELGPEGVIDGMATHARNLLAGHKVKAIGVGVPGPMSSRQGIVFETPNLPGWFNTPARTMLEDRLHLPVVLNNDANAAAYGEYWAGAGAGIDMECMILFTLGTGVGGGIIMNGKLYVGPDDTAGELGHMCINFNGPECGCGSHGCLEAYASATAIRREVKEALAAGTKTSIHIPEGAEDDFGAKVVYDAAVAGDAFAIDFFGRVGDALGVAAATIINMLNPDMIVYGGALANAGDYIFEPLKKRALINAFNQPAKRAQIVKAKLGNYAGIIGAAGLAMEG